MHIVGFMALMCYIYQCLAYLQCMLHESCSYSGLQVQHISSNVLIILDKDHSSVMSCS